MMIRERTRKLMSAVQVGGDGNGKLNGLKKYALWLSVVIASMAVGGYIFDLVGNIVSQGMKVSHSETRIEEITRQILAMENEVNERKLADAKFQAEMKETINAMKKSLETMQHIVWKLDKKMAVIESIDANVRKLTNEDMR